MGDCLQYHPIINMLQDIMKHQSHINSTGYFIKVPFS